MIKNMKEETLEKMNENRARVRGLNDLLSEVTNSGKAGLFSLQYGYQKEYLTNVVVNAILLERSKLEREFENF